MTTVAFSTCWRRVSALAMTGAVLAFFSGCQDNSEMMGPVDPQLAKGGNPGKPVDSEGDYELLEFFVYRVDGINMVHVAGRGDVEYVNLDVHHDYFFNGIADDNLSAHYEIYNAAPYPVAVHPDEITGVFSVNIPWNGGMVYYDPVSGTNKWGEYHDFKTTSVDGTGADPFTFHIRFQRENGDYLNAFQPQGIVLGEDTSGVDSTGVASEYDALGIMDVYSYAVFKGEGPAGEVFLTEVTLDSASLSCKTAKVREWEEGIKTTREIARITGTVHIRTGSLPTGETLSTWMESHFVHRSSSSDTPEFFRGYAASDGNPADGVDVTFTQSLPLPSDGPLLIQLAVDYLITMGADWAHVYNPERNTTIGVFTDWSGPAKRIGDPWPVAYAPVLPIEVTCR